VRDAVATRKLTFLVASAKMKMTGTENATHHATTNFERILYNDSVKFCLSCLDVFRHGKHVAGLKTAENDCVIAPLSSFLRAACKC
jgi:hypothetical protein